jgi:class 3 adenylate cyclase
MKPPSPNAAQGIARSSKSPLTIDDLMTLVETGRELAAEVSLRTLLKSILTRACQLTNSPDASIILCDDRRGILYFAHAIGSKAKMVMERWGEHSSEGIPISGSKAGEVFTTGRSMVIASVAGDDKHFKGVDKETRKRTSSMVCVPLSETGNRLGVVQILNKRSGNYTQRDRVLLEHFATQAAVAIRNARLFEDLLGHMGLYASKEEGRGPMELWGELSRPACSEVLTVLFADMRCFTQFCHVVGHPERAQQLLNEYLSMLAATVIEYRGIVNKFLGDGLMALFRDGDHARRAVQCACRMQELFVELRDRWDEQINVPLGFLDLGIGITTDQVIVGSMGTDRIRDFTAVGTGVNLASYLKDQARNGQRILVDKRTFRAVRDIIGESEGPEPFEYRKPGQTVGIPYERYTIKSLKLPKSTSSVAVPARQAVIVDRSKDIFVSYSHKDKEWLEKFQIHLKPYARSGSLTFWDDTQIHAGKRWRDEINAALASAKVAVLLVSPNFLDSDFIASGELPPLLTAAERGGLKILWVPLSASSYDETEIEKFQAAWDPTNPLDSLTSSAQNRAWVTLCKKVKTAVAGR